MRTTRVKLKGTIMDDESAEIMRYYGWNDNCCPADIESAAGAADDGTLDIVINSAGGDLIAGFEIYGIIKAFSGAKTAHIQSHSASAASVAMMACDRIVAEPVSLICIHNPSTVSWGDMRELRHAADELDNIKDAIINAYMTRTKKTRGEISDLMDRDVFIDAEKALEYGLIDEINQTAPSKVVNAVGGYAFPTAEMREKYRNAKAKERAQVTLDSLL